MWYRTLYQLGMIMTFTFQPWQFYAVILAGWINRQQQEVIDYWRTENRVLRETHGPKRILLNDDQRRRLAVSRTSPIDGVLFRFLWGGRSKVFTTFAFNL